VSKAEVELPRADYQTQSDGHGGLANRPPRDSAASARPVLVPDQSATLKERLVAELSAIKSADDAAAWAHRNLPVKNTLTSGDAQIVEARFQARLATIGDGMTAEGPPNAAPDQRVLSAGRLAADTSQKPLTVAEQRSRGRAVRAFGKTVRLRDKKHRKFVTRQPCLVCGRVPSDSHHLTFYTTACAWRQSQRRVHRPSLPDPSPRASSLWGRGRLVAEAQHRSASGRPQALAAHPAQPR